VNVPAYTIACTGKSVYNCTFYCLLQIGLFGQSQSGTRHSHIVKHILSGRTFLCPSWNNRPSIKAKVTPKTLFPVILIIIFLLYYFLIPFHNGFLWTFGAPVVDVY